MGVMKLWHRIRIDELERGLVFRDGAPERLLGPGRYFLADPGRNLRIEKVSIRKPWLQHSDLEMIVKSGVLAGQALVLDLKDHERAIVWIDGRIDAVCSTGLHVLWTVKHEIRIETVDARGVRFEHPDLSVILTARGASAFLETTTVAAGWTALVFQNGRLTTTLEPGVHAFWRGESDLRIYHVELREQTAEINGQEIMTADKVTLRLNAMVTYRVIDPVQAVTAVDDVTQALYRQAQLALRAVVGTRELDALLADKDGVAAELEAALRARATALGLEVRTVGVRDLILPGEMRTLLNRVTEARKAAEAALVTRREETAAIRSQANTARIFETNPTLMRLRELEVLEKVAEKSNLSVVLGEGGLADRVVKLL
jgi:regulator of protease activity HflC (stomatin/prohibitin superfamily)